MKTLWRHREGESSSRRVAVLVVAAARRSAMVRRGARALARTAAGRQGRPQGGTDCEAMLGRG